MLKYSPLFYLLLTTSYAFSDYKTDFPPFWEEPSDEQHAVILFPIIITNNTFSSISVESAFQEVSYDYNGTKINGFLQGNSANYYIYYDKSTSNTLIPPGVTVTTLHTLRQNNSMTGIAYSYANTSIDINFRSSDSSGWLLRITSPKNERGDQKSKCFECTEGDYIIKGEWCQTHDTFDNQCLGDQQSFKVMDKEVSWAISWESILSDALVCTYGIMGRTPQFSTPGKSPFQGPGCGRLGKDFSNLFSAEPNFSRGQPKEIKVSTKEYYYTIKAIDSNGTPIDINFEKQDMIEKQSSGEYKIKKWQELIKEQLLFNFKNINFTADITLTKDGVDLNIKHNSPQPKFEIKTLSSQYVRNIVIQFDKESNRYQICDQSNGECSQEETLTTLDNFRGEIPGRSGSAVIYATGSKPLNPRPYHPFLKPMSCSMYDDTLGQACKCNLTQESNLVKFNYDSSDCIYTTNNWNSFPNMCPKLEDLINQQGYLSHYAISSRGFNPDSVPLNTITKEQITSSGYGTRSYITNDMKAGCSYYINSMSSSIDITSNLFTINASGGGWQGGSCEYSCSWTTHPIYN